MAIEVFNRYENKYVLDEATYRSFSNQLLAYMELDDYNKQHERYTIANLYYDTPSNTIIRHSLSKPKYKEKLRLRAYGTPAPDAKVYLEIKKKFNGLVNKRRTALRLHEAYAFVSTGDAPMPQPYMNHQVIGEIAYMLTQYELQPAVYLAYERQAMFSKESRDLRITFDTNIQSRRYDLELESGPYGEQLLEPGQWLMEIKAEKTMPLWLSRLLAENRMYRTGFSKYGNEYKRMIAARRTEKERVVHA
ncbi:polyphosphate polymerase domain-containing protein [Paenibacillus sp. IB182496]|uniref:Polyphosphate polymerase domain-containing protein n=1 Tax=Paenibacillus sabuli TaxID=2772509 RepID=A0A927BSY7_9BACL|nr:polyphosphate polymerase domain-containing protein [Paenibacillus sabuli]MBD2845331.1 polyphosphate polymerase domain-containing protein [Paenibacillus sabuli]